MDSLSPSPIALFPICLVKSLTWLICCYLSPPMSLEKEIIKVYMKLIIYFDFIYFKNKSPKIVNIFHHFLILVKSLVVKIQIRKRERKVDLTVNQFFS